MASPQLENGHTRIANEILEALARLPIASNHWQVLFCIIRKTYGFNKKADWISNSQIETSTGLCSSVVSRALRQLVARKIIIRAGKLIGIQKNWEDWQGMKDRLPPTPKKERKLKIYRPDGYIGIYHTAVEPEYQIMVSAQGYVLEHRLVIARKLGRCLESWEIVHHKDGNKGNNSEDNLELLPTATEHLSSMAAQKRIKDLEKQLAELQRKVSEPLAEQSSLHIANLAEQSSSDVANLANPVANLANPSRKVSSRRVIQKTKDNTIQKKTHGEFKNVLLTDEEFQKLKEKFTSEVDNMIEQLSAYIASKGKKYKSHYATILSWQRRKDGTNKHSRELPKSYTAPPKYGD